MIEDDVWIGANCVLLDGAVLRRGCVVAAGSLVRSELPAYSICRGIPGHSSGSALLISSEMLPITVLGSGGLDWQCPCGRTCGAKVFR